MKVIDDIESEETLSDEKLDDLFFALLNGKTITDKIETARGEFTVKFPRQKDVLEIDRNSAILRCGIPVTSFDSRAEYEIQKCAVLDVMVVSGPPWYENHKKKAKNFSWKDAPDAGFTDELFAKALVFREKIQGKLGKGKKKLSESDVGKDVSAPLDDGLFSGASCTAERA
jgi:hypothetical protein